MDKSNDCRLSILKLIHRSHVSNTVIIIGAAPPGRPAAARGVGWTKTMRKVCKDNGVSWDDLHNRIGLKLKTRSIYEVYAENGGQGEVETKPPHY